MAVFTRLDTSDISALLAPLGYAVASVEPASHGIENSNFLIRASDAHGDPAGLVLTVLEGISAAAVPWFITLLDTLQSHGLPVPAALHEPMAVAGKAALLVPWLPGHHVDTPGAEHCRQIGAALGRLHQCPLPERPATGDATALEQLASEIPRLPAADARRADALLTRWRQTTLPRGLIHADLFRDNALFERGQLSGLLDFYAAGPGPLVFDLAVALNDWCMPDDQPDPALTRALLDGYQQQRTLTQAEKDALPLALAIAALRFWLSRRRAERRHEEEQLPDTVRRKDPAQFQRRLTARLTALSDWPDRHESGR